VRLPVIATVVLSCPAATASAQDAQQDDAERIVREAETARRGAIERAISAPATAFDRIERSPAARPPDVAKPLTSIPWTTVGCVFGGVVVLLAFRAAWKRAGVER